MNIHVNNKAAAWKLIDMLSYNTQFNHSKERSAGAGYDIFVGATYYDYICVLSDRLEWNRNDGTTINIWYDIAE